MSKVWLVTGSSRGLGRAIVGHALDAGDRVIATARRPAQLHDLAAEHGDRILPLALDVTDPEQAQQVVQAGLKAFGRLDVVVNNAGYGDLAAFEDMAPDMFRAQMETNFYGVVNVTGAVLPALREQGGGHIFQVSSLGGRVGTVGLSAYQSAKWAVGGFSTVLAAEVAPFGIKVTVLEPGGMRTDWAGPSMTVPEISAPYRQTVGRFADLLRESSGQEPTGVRRVAEIVAELAGREDAPLRLLLGSDAATYGKAVGEELAASDARWFDLSVSASDPVNEATESLTAVSRGRG
ncbi:SDR family NAD(P)-dependent oxidoreductase [Kineosporia mesophila]|uniref:SDR family NAD(P)-dependent oxidoreductase n=1 Tax=Kineosporia mesophila TaxID=566012 RepID=A0ABP7AKL6_9ACTN|nr:SDR family NAD(P)-dependent oxidoreductase [Kineosporia mesophila]